MPEQARHDGVFGATDPPAPVFSRKGGSPDWIPTFAGKQATCDYFVDFSTASPALSAALPTLFAADVIAASLLFCAPWRLNR